MDPDLSLAVGFVELLDNKALSTNSAPVSARCGKCGQTSTESLLFIPSWTSNVWEHEQSHTTRCRQQYVVEAEDLRL